MMMDQDFGRAVELVNKSNNILITTHTRPDGDACGSVIAMQKALESAGKNTLPLFLSEIPHWYQFLFAKPPAVLTKETTPEEIFAEADFTPDLIIIVDTNSYNQLSSLENFIKQNKKPVLIFDHHVTNDGLGDVQVIDTSAAAAGQIVFKFLQFADFQITPEMANALFVAIATDTGWFSFKNTNSEVFTDCAKLVKMGCEPAKLHHDLYQSFTPQRFQLLAQMLNTLELHFDNRYATQYLTQKHFKKTGADRSDTENLINECQRISSLEVVTLFIELPDGKFKCSLRSTGSVDVRLIAQKFGGGGHIMASGTSLPGPLDNAQKLIYDEVKKQLL